MYRGLLTSLILFFISVSAHAQDDRRNNLHGNQGREFMAGAVWHPRGLGISVMTSKEVKQHNWRIWDLDFVSMKDPREYKIKSTSFSPSGLYSYGKLNFAYFLRTGFGRKRQLASRWYNNTISTELMVSAGISTAFLKPVYLDIYYPLPDNSSGYLASEKFDPAIHTDQSIIFGNSSFTKGLDELTLQAGLYTKLAFQFDWSDYDDSIRSFELGAVIDFYPRSLPIMAFVENRNVYTSLYICLNIGNRW